LHPLAEQSTQPRIRHIFHRNRITVWRVFSPDSDVVHAAYSSAQLLAQQLLSSHYRDIDGIISPQRGDRQLYTGAMAWYIAHASSIASSV